MADAPDLFARRNRTRIIAVMLVATINYMLAVALAGVAVGVGIVLTIVFGLDVFPDDEHIDALFSKLVDVFIRSGRVADGGVADIREVPHLHTFTKGGVFHFAKVAHMDMTLEMRALSQTGKWTYIHIILKHCTFHY